MNRKLLALVSATALSLSGLGGANAHEADVAPFLTVNVAPEDAEVTEGERIDGTEFSDSRPVADGPVGPVPVFFADDEYGCSWATATASGELEWIGVARRGPTEVDGLDQCPGFQTKITQAAAAGAGALVTVNFEPGHEVGTAAGTIPAIMVGNEEGERLLDSLDPSEPEALLVTLEALNPDDMLPPRTLRPTEVTQLDASHDGGAVAVNGRAMFRGELPVVVGEDPEGDPPLHPELARLGLDATHIALRHMDPFDSEVEFIIKVSELNHLPPPEVIRYLWQFTVDDEEYWVQAKTSDFTTATAFADDPAGTATSVTGSFRLRGNCGPIQTPPVGPVDPVTVANSCEHLAWIGGSFEVGLDEVHIQLPLGLAVAPEIVPGATIEDGEMTVSIQAAVSNATTSDTVIQELPYTIPTREVRLGIVPAGAAPSFTTSTTAAANGQFNGLLDVSGLDPGDYDVVAEACWGTNCGTATVPITI